MLSIAAEEDLSPFRGLTSTKMAQGMNHDLFRAMFGSHALVRRLGHTEKTLYDERENLKKARPELTTARDNEAIAYAEKEEIIRHEKATIEENKSLKSKRAAVRNQFQSAKAGLEAAEGELTKLRESGKAAEEEIARLKRELASAKKSAVEKFLKTDDYQALLMPVFLQGFDHAKERIAALLPDFKDQVAEVQAVQPAQTDEGEEGEEEEEATGEGQEEDRSASGQPEQVGQAVDQTGN